MIRIALWDIFVRVCNEYRALLSKTDLFSEVSLSHSMIHTEFLCYNFCHSPESLSFGL